MPLATSRRQTLSLGNCWMLIGLTLSLLGTAYDDTAELKDAARTAPISTFTPPHLGRTV